MGRDQDDDFLIRVVIGGMFEKSAEEGDGGEEGHLVDGAADFLVDQAIDGHRLPIPEIDTGAGGPDKEVGQVDEPSPPGTAPDSPSGCH